MKKSELFAIIVAKVCEVCEVCKDCIFNPKVHRADVVAARALAVQYMRRVGLLNDEIALLVLRAYAGDPNLCPPDKEVKKKSKNIQQLFNGYSQRCIDSYAFCLMSVEIRDFCRERYGELYLAGMKELPRR